MEVGINAHAEWVAEVRARGRMIGSAKWRYYYGTTFTLPLHYLALTLRYLGTLGADVPR